MKITLLAFFFVLIATSTQVQSGDTWELVDNPGALSGLIKGNALASKDWEFYFRADGKLASMQYGSIAIREWSITERGEVCYAVFSMPDKIIRCETIEKTTSSPPRYRMITEYGSFKFEVKNPSAELVNAILERAGPE